MDVRKRGAEMLMSLKLAHEFQPALIYAEGGRPGGA